MRLLGFEISLRRKAAPTNLQTVYSQYSWLNSWWTPIRESFSGAWQQNVTVEPPVNLMTFSALYHCVTGIAADVAKMRIKLAKNNNGIWEEITDHQPWLPLLRKPNHYQNRIEFIEGWIISKLMHGNAYILKQRQDKRGLVTAMYVLDPSRVTPLVAQNGDVYYELRPDYLSQVGETVTVPASEIIHDKMPWLWHPLVGVSPIYACGTSATMGKRIQNNSTNLFSNLSRPGGILEVPGAITDETAAKLKQIWESGYGGANVGRTAILSDGMKFIPMAIPAETAQLIQQLKWTVEDTGLAFHYPQWKLTGNFPPYSSGPQALTQMYYNDCLHPLIEKLELSLDEGLELPTGMGTELDLENLMRMDTAALFESNARGVQGAFLSPNEARFRANLAPVPGGDTPYLQMQNWSLEMLAQRSKPPDGSDSVVPSAPPGTPEKPEPQKQLEAPPERLALPAKSMIDVEDLEFFETELVGAIPTFEP